MKKFLVIFLILVAGVTNFANAQTPKFGHIDIQQLITVMPERTTAISEMEKTTKELEDMLGTMQTELQTMIKDYTDKQSTMSDLVRQAKEDDIRAKQQRIETFRDQSEQQLQQKQQDLMKPIISKADSCIEVVAKEQGLIYVFDISSRVVLYKSNQSVDILPLVKKKMGIEK
ncbi:MAG TPA: OmpH family outer membrane protein [Prolixibacteraceae bacterium]|nr:OmpH family outer membrane protein [Prolixibacteraceae bacterium]HPS12989.1 OmpH family outer membrane protein [Prolixibacteraceae bacterium]